MARSITLLNWDILNRQDFCSDSSNWTSSTWLKRCLGTGLLTFLSYPRFFFQVKNLFRFLLQYKTSSQIDTFNPQYILFQGWNSHRRNFLKDRLNVRRYGNFLLLLAILLLALPTSHPSIYSSSTHPVPYFFAQKMTIC